MFSACPIALPEGELHIGRKRAQAGFGASTFCIRKAGLSVKWSADKTEKGSHQAAFAHAR
jgi:hypothetical protein